jgi:hypothetical protein
MAKLIISLKPDADDSALLGFPFGENQYVLSEYVGGADRIDSYDVEIDLADEEDSTVAQERFLDSCVDVVSYEIVEV